MSVATITYKGQITIPKDVREALGIQTGDRVFFIVEGDKAMMFPIRARGLQRLRGVGKGRAPFPGRDTEREAARQGVARHALGLRGDHADSQD